jgi:hypothetical protein
MTPAQTTADRLKKGDTIDWFGVQGEVEQVIKRTDGMLIIQHSLPDGDSSFLTLKPDSVVDVLEEEP